MVWSDGVCVTRGGRVGGWLHAVGADANALLCTKPPRVDAAVVEGCAGPTVQRLCM